MNNQGRTQLQSIVEGLKQQSAKEAQASRDVQDRTKKEFHDTQMQLSHAMNRADDLDKEVKRLTVKLAEQNKVRVPGVQYRTVFLTVCRTMSRQVGANGQTRLLRRPLHLDWTCDVYVKM